MADNAWKIGDRVQLNSGGPTMTVDAINDDGTVRCTWFDDKKELKSESFHPDTIHEFKYAFG